MIILDDIKLDYSDVLIRPKRSTLTSRFDVEMEQTYTFYHSKKSWTGVPIMASNMDTTGTFDMHDELSKHGMVTCIARHHNTNGIGWGMAKNRDKLCVMSGISFNEISEIVGVANTFPDIAFVGLDVETRSKDSVAKALSKMKEVRFVSTLLGRHDLMVFILAEDVTKLSKVLYEEISSLPGVRFSESSIGLKYYKYDYRWARILD